MENELQSFWGVKLLPHEKKLLDTKDELYTVMSSVCLKEKGNEPQKVARLFANIRSVVIPDCHGKCCCEETKQKDSRILLASLTPGVNTFLKQHMLFSPLDEVELVNESDVEFHLSGFYAPIESFSEPESESEGGPEESEDESEDEDEDEEQEQVKVEDLKQRFIEFSKKQPEKPAPKPKQNKKGSK